MILFENKSSFFMPIMNESSLQPGDIIFFENMYKADAPDLDAQPYIDHVGMFAGYDESGNPQIVHSITGSKGHYHPEKASGLCVTTLRALRGQTQEDGRCYDVNYHVFRGKFPEITQKALEIFKQQAAYRIPYDEQRLDEKLKREEAFEGNDFMALGMESYLKAGIYRAIKYAARFPHPFTRTRGTGVGRGLTCSMGVILSYQVAELYLDDKIIPVNSFLNEWPSDKYAPSTPSHPFHTEAYNAYLAKLRKKTEKIYEQNGLKLSIDFWKGNSDPQTYRHKTYALDSKVVGAEGMYLYMHHNTEAWEYLGELKVATRHFKPDDKIIHRQKLVTSYQQFIETIRKEVHDFPIALSPAPSPTPASLEKNELWWNRADISTRMLGTNMISSAELQQLKDVDITEVLGVKAKQLTQDLSYKQLTIIMGLLLNSSVINFIIITQGSMDTLPTYFPNKEVCYQELPYLIQENSVKAKGEKRPTVLFYPNSSLPPNHTYSIFLHILFKEFIACINTISEDEKITLLKELTTTGRSLAGQKNPLDAVAMYQAAQLIYCLLEKPNSQMHEQMMQLFLLKISAYKSIGTMLPSRAIKMQMHVSSERRRAIDMLHFMKEIIKPETYSIFYDYPVVKKVRDFEVESDTNAPYFSHIVNQFS